MLTYTLCLFYLEPTLTANLSSVQVHVATKIHKFVLRRPSTASLISSTFDRTAARTLISLWPSSTSNSFCSFLGLGICRILFLECSHQVSLLYSCQAPAETPGSKAFPWKTPMSHSLATCTCFIFLSATHSFVWLLSVFPG